MSFQTFLTLTTAYISTVKAITCSSGYSCYEDSSNTVWVRNQVESFHESCSQSCLKALSQDPTPYACDNNHALVQDTSSFTPIAQGLGFSCTTNEFQCWNGLIPDNRQSIWVSGGNTVLKSCYFADKTKISSNTFDCDAIIDNANCFGQRFSKICPCTKKELKSVCDWSKTANEPKIFDDDWGTKGADLNTINAKTSCLDRINYYRKKACDENWPECPPSGLPPYTECKCCNNCANSQAQYDKIILDNTGNAHSSFTRCGEWSQGEGGAGAIDEASCARVIDMFVNERNDAENFIDGEKRCRGHCEPILKHGCNTFFWGEYQGFFTINYGACNVEKCNGYCNNPTDNECFTSGELIAPDVGVCLE